MRQLLVLLLFSTGLLLTSCAEQPAFDSAEYLRQQYAKQSGQTQATTFDVPFQLSGDVLEVVNAKLKPVGDDRSRVARILDYVFSGLDLEYTLAPTRDANSTFAEREGNCLSFVNLFVALGRHMRLSPFYVEVEDYQRWDHRQGMVVSQGHIVAGLYIRGELRTYDFLPYRVKSYRDFKPIDDLTAAAHYFNNLGAEALLAGDEQTAYNNLKIAADIDPQFLKGANNLGVWYARKGKFDRALQIYQKSLKVDPDNVPLLTNMARVYQQLGRHDEAEAILLQLEGVQHTNPFFFVYKGEAALSRGDHAQALEFMRQGLERDPDTPEVHLGLAKVYFALGELEKMKHHLSRSLLLDATNLETRKFAAMVDPSMRKPVE